MLFIAKKTRYFPTLTLASGESPANAVLARGLF